VAHCTECEVNNDASCKACEGGYTLEGADGVQECKKNGLSGGAIAGIVIAIIVVVAVIVFLCVWFLVCKKRRTAGAVA